MSAYFDELCKAMEMFAAHPRSIIMGQAVACDGTAMRGTLRGVVASKLLELPVAEDMQLGMAIGMSLAGDLPLCVYPRINFLLLAMSQLVLHLDKMPMYGNGWRPKVVMRTAIASPRPLDPGPQHLGHYADALRDMLRTVAVVKLRNPKQIVPEYRRAMEGDGSTLLVEYMEAY